MFDCIKSRENGEYYIVKPVSIKTSDLENGSVLSYSDYIGDLDSPEVFDNVEKFCKRLGL